MLNMLNKQTFLNILEMIFINLNTTENFLLNKLIQLILLVYESYVCIQTWMIILLLIQQFQLIMKYRKIYN